VKFLAGVISAAGLGVAAVVAIVASGAYDVAASVPHLPTTDWLLQTTMERSVAARADTVGAPPEDLSDPARIRRGASHFSVLCSTCHGAPGVEVSDIGKGLDPPAPSLGEVAREWSPRELFWIVDHGVKFTGMPAFGATQSASEIWDIVAFLRALPGISPEDYQRTTA